MNGMHTRSDVGVGSETENADPVSWQSLFTRAEQTRSVVPVGAADSNSSPRHVETGIHVSEGVMVCVVVGVVVSVVVVGVVVIVVVPVVVVGVVVAVVVADVVVGVVVMVVVGVDGPV